jgi:chemotaxis family two-component system response regulator Rcp1
LSSATAAESGSNPNRGEAPLSTSRSRSDSPPRKPLILIVEDSKADIYLIREAIDSCTIDADIDVLRDGYTATQYFDSADATDSIPCPDLVVLDLNLPKANGGEVLMHLRASPRCKYAKVLIVSSSDAPQDRCAVKNLDAAGYFKKPSNYAEFMTLGPTIKNLLERV